MEVPRKNLFGDNDEEESQFAVKINHSYAESYGKWRAKEELQKLKDRYGNDPVDSSSSSTESDDFDPEDFDPDAEKNFLAVLSALKSKNPTIYDASEKFFREREENTVIKESPQKKEKPMFLKDYERKVILEKEGQLVDEDNEDGEGDNLPYVDQQRKLKQSFKVSLGDGESDDDFLKPRQKSDSEKIKEEDEYLTWLKGKKEDASVGDDKKEPLKFLRDYWNDPNLESSEKFLKDYLLNKRYFDGDDDDDDDDDNNNNNADDEDRKIDEIPVSTRIVDEADFDDDERMLEAQEQFEHKYNFRFEEPDAEFLKQYPRTVKDSLRRKDEARKEKRESYKERKLKEKRQRREELKRLKNLKRKEITEKLKKLKHATGEDQIPLDPDEFEKDFDPAEYDRKMKEIFNDDYYGKANGDEEKPVFTPSEGDDTDEEAIEKWPLNTDPGPGPGPSASSSSDTTFSKKMGERTKKFADAIRRKKPVFDPGEKSFEQYFDEYYKLDYEDIIGGDTVCRFKYRKVVPNDFGLSTDEILQANPKELNAWVSLRKMSQYRSDRDELYDVSAYKKKAADGTKKRRVLLSLYEKSCREDGASETVGSQKREINKKHETIGEINKPVSVETTKKSGKRNKPTNPVENVSDERLRAYGINPKKLKNKIKYKIKNSTS